MEYQFPPDFDPVARDLIEKLLIREHDKRLGAGLPGSLYDIKQLKKHPFFKGIDFENLQTTPPPIKPKSKSVLGISDMPGESFEIQPLQNQKKMTHNESMIRNEETLLSSNPHKPKRSPVNRKDNGE